jgi:hypothetical protein
VPIAFALEALGHMFSGDAIEKVTLEEGLLKEVIGSVEGFEVLVEDGLVKGNGVVGVFVANEFLVYSSECPLGIVSLP